MPFNLHISALSRSLTSWFPQGYCNLNCSMILFFFFFSLQTFNLLSRAKQISNILSLFRKMDAGTAFSSTPSPQQIVQQQSESKVTVSSITPLRFIRTSPSVGVPCTRNRKAWSKARNGSSWTSWPIPWSSLALNTVFPALRHSTKAVNALVGNSF